MEKPNLGFFKKYRYAWLTAGGALLLGAWFAIAWQSRAEEQHLVQNETQLDNLSFSEILANPALTQYAVRTSAPLFAEHCAACHGEKGAGHQTEEGLYAPVLNDKDWLFEGRIDAIYAAIANGSQGVMPAYRKKLSSREIDALAKYLKALSNGQSTHHAMGEKVFADSGCPVCHGEDAKGNQTLGSPNLTDSAWRFQDSVAGIKRTIAYGVNSGDPKDRVTVMPKFADKLTPIQIKKLALYVYQLSAPTQ
jgi:cytochrome c oxidase cbb3-type subunit 3